MATELPHSRQRAVEARRRARNQAFWAAPSIVCGGAVRRGFATSAPPERIVAGGRPPLEAQALVVEALDRHIADGGGDEAVGAGGGSRRLLHPRRLVLEPGLVRRHLARLRRDHPAAEAHLALLNSRRQCVSWRPLCRSPRMLRIPCGSCARPRSSPQPWC